MFARTRKLILVSILTCLIWVWADRAMTGYYPDVPAIIHIDKQTDPHLWVTFDKQTMASLQLKVSGPAAKIDAMEKQLKEKGTLGFDLYFNPAQEKMAAAATPYRLPLLQFVQSSKLIQDMGLTVESCSPEAINVEVVKLVNKKLTIQVLNENRVAVSNVVLDPATVEMAVPENWTGEALKATISLTPQEIEQSAPVLRKAVVELAAGITRPSDTMVTVRLPSTETKLKDFTVIDPKIGINFSYDMQGEYKVEIINKTQVLAPLKIRATPEAMEKYEKIPLKLRLNIFQDDKNATELEREITCNLLEEYVRKGEIMVNESPARIAKFKLIKIDQTEKTAAAGEMGEMPGITPPKLLN